MTKPAINVTPLIDVLLVLLIIFMVVTPMKPSSFKAQVPQEAKNDNAEPNPLTLVVSIDRDSSLRLNKMDENMGSVDDAAKIIEKLKGIFAERTANHTIAFGREKDPDNIEKTVFIKAPRGLNYGSVAKIVDAVKISGAKPISLQIDGLN